MRLVLDIRPNLLSWLHDARAAVVQLRIRRDDVLRVPAGAVVHEAEKSFCFVDTSRGYEKRYVEPGLEDGTYTEIKSGIDKGAQVVTNPLALLAPK